MASKKSVYTLIFAIATVVASAQFRLPQFDVEVKGQQNLLPGSGGNGNMDFFETSNYYLGAHVQISQHFAVGGFYSNSFRGADRYSGDNFSIDNKGQLLLKGLDVRLSSGRSKNWRKYLTLNYSKVQLVEDNGDYRLATKVNAIGASLGIMRKLSNKLYLTVIELGVKSLSEEIFWAGSSNKIMLDAKMGVLYNIGKRK